MFRIAAPLHLHIQTVSTSQHGKGTSVLGSCVCLPGPHRFDVVVQPAPENQRIGAPDTAVHSRRHLKVQSRVAAAGRRPRHPLPEGGHPHHAPLAEQPAATQGELESSHTSLL